MSESVTVERKFVALDSWDFEWKKGAGGWKCWAYHGGICRGRFAHESELESDNPKLQWLKDWPELKAACLKVIRNNRIFVSCHFDSCFDGPGTVRLDDGRFYFRTDTEHWTQINLAEVCDMAEVHPSPGSWPRVKAFIEKHSGPVWVVTEATLASGPCVALSNDENRIFNFTGSWVGGTWIPHAQKRQAETIWNKIRPLEEDETFSNGNPDQRRYKMRVHGNRLQGKWSDDTLWFDLEYRDNFPERLRYFNKHRELKGNELRTFQGDVFALEIWSGDFLGIRGEGPDMLIFSREQLAQGVDLFSLGGNEFSRACLAWYDANRELAPNEGRNDKGEIVTFEFVGNHMHAMSAGLQCVWGPEVRQWWSERPHLGANLFDAAKSYFIAHRKLEINEWMDEETGKVGTFEMNDIDVSIIGTDFAWTRGAARDGHWYSSTIFDRAKAYHGHMMAEKGPEMWIDKENSATAMVNGCLYHYRPTGCPQGNCSDDTWSALREFWRGNCRLEDDEWIDAQGVLLNFTVKNGRVLTYHGNALLRRSDIAQWSDVYAKNRKLKLLAALDKAEKVGLIECEVTQIVGKVNGAKIITLEVSPNGGCLPIGKVKLTVEQLEAK